MGYTHYFPQTKEVPLDQWAAFKADVLRLFDARQASFETAGYQFDERLVLVGWADKATDDDEAVLTEASQLFSTDADGEDLCFNGDVSRDLDHETFVLTQYRSLGFAFCKTARKPYDWFVVACLLLAEKHCPGCWEISSDGDPEEWQPVLAWLEANGFGAMKLPAKVV